MVIGCVAASAIRQDASRRLINSRSNGDSQSMPRLKRLDGKVPRTRAPDLVTMQRGSKLGLRSSRWASFLTIGEVIHSSIAFLGKANPSRSKKTSSNGEERA